MQYIIPIIRYILLYVNSLLRIHGHRYLSIQWIHRLDYQSKGGAVISNFTVSLWSQFRVLYGNIFCLKDSKCGCAGHSLGGVCQWSVLVGVWGVIKLIWRSMKSRVWWGAWNLIFYFRNFFNIKTKMILTFQKCNWKLGIPHCI